MKKTSTDKFRNGSYLPVMEEFCSLQGEGYNTGTAAYFIRIGGCDTGCYWCDVRESWDESLHPLLETSEIVKRVVQSGSPNVLITGGEPLRYNLDFLCNELQKNNIKTYLETSGSEPLSGKWDWICFSPKVNAAPLDIFYECSHELKVIIRNSQDFLWAEHNKSKFQKDILFFLQPEWSVYNEIIYPVIDYIKSNPQWRLSLQTHKFLRIP